MPSEISQQEKKIGELKIKMGGDNKPKGKSYTQMPNEYLDFFSNRNLVQFDKFQLTILLRLFRELQGWEQQEKQLSQRDLERATGIPHKNFNLAINQLVEAGIVTRRKEKGQRLFFFGFNEELMGRTLAAQDPKGINLNALSVPKSGTPASVPKSGTPDIPKSGTSNVYVLGTRDPYKVSKLKRNSKPKDIKDNIKDISLSRFSEFLKGQSPYLRPRWERLISSIIRKHPEDVNALELAIMLVHKEKKDFLGVPIKASIVGLFEKCEWSMMKDMMFIKLKVEQERRDKEMKAKEIEANLAATKKELKEQGADVDVSKISSLFRKYAERKSE